MIYLYTFLLTAVYLINSQVNLPGYVVLVSSAIMYLLIYMYVSAIYGQLTAIVTMMIVSLPFAWNPIWGDSVGGSIITWFYIWLGVMTAFLFIKKTHRKIHRYQKWIVYLSILLLVYSLIPFVASQSLLEGMKEFLMIGCFLLIMLGINISGISCNVQSKDFLISIYIFTVFLISAGMLIQYVGFKTFGIALFGFKQMYSWNGGIQTGCHLLMEDASSGTIMIGAGAMLGLINRKQNKLYLPQLVIIVIGMACSGRRTGALTLVIFMGIYFIMGVKSLKGKITSIIFFGVLSILLLYFMSASRSILNAEQMFDNNGRFQLWYEGIQLFKKSPILGYGFDNVYLEKVLMPSKMIVHNTVIRWLDMGGVFYGASMCTIFILWILLLYKKEQYDFMWCVLYCCAAAMLIPDLLNARFIYVIALISIMSVNEMTVTKKWG